MAKCCAHGREIGTIYYRTAAKRYMSDGVILINQGFGWKRYGKVKPHLTPEQVFKLATEKQQARDKDYPAAAHYRRLLHSLAGLSKRWKLHAAVELMPDDSDGVWSEACDGWGDNCTADHDEVAELCRAYKIALIEADDIKQEQAIAAEKAKNAQALAVATR